MVNTQLLEKAIDNKGIKKGFLCEKLGISRTALDKKMKNAYKFRVAEVYVICDLLGINNDSEKESIFFASDVHENVN